MRSRNDNNIRIAAVIGYDEKERLNKYAEAHDMTISQIIRKALNEFLKNQEA